MTTTKRLSRIVLALLAALLALLLVVSLFGMDVFSG